jgi:uncharacterized protein YndB with AHSA1/START domain
MSGVVVTRWIAASPPTVFTFFTDVEGWTAWQGVGGKGRCARRRYAARDHAGRRSSIGIFHRGRSSATRRFTWGRLRPLDR